MWKLSDDFESDDVVYLNYDNTLTGEEIGIGVLYPTDSELGTYLTRQECVLIARELCDVLNVLEYTSERAIENMFRPCRVRKSRRRKTTSLTVSVDEATLELFNRFLEENRCSVSQGGRLLMSEALTKKYGDKNE